MKGRVSLGHSNQVQYSGFNALWRYSYQHCWYLSINCLFSSLVVLEELTLFLLDNFSNINIGSVFFIRYNLYIFMFIFFQTPVKRIYKAFYFRGGCNFFFLGVFIGIRGGTPDKRISEALFCLFFYIVFIFFVYFFFPGVFISIIWGTPDKRIYEGLIFVFFVFIGIIGGTLINVFLRLYFALFYFCLYFFRFIYFFWCFYKHYRGDPW